MPSNNVATFAMTSQALPAPNDSHCIVHHATCNSTYTFPSHKRLPATRQHDDKWWHHFFTHNADKNHWWPHMHPHMTPKKADLHQCTPSKPNEYGKVWSPCATDDECWIPCAPQNHGTYATHSSWVSFHPGSSTADAVPTTKPSSTTCIMHSWPHFPSYHKMAKCLKKTNPWIHG